MNPFVRLKQFDIRLSAAFANAVRRSHNASLIFRFGASYAIWLMIGAVCLMEIYLYREASLVFLTIAVFLLIPWIITIILEFLIRRPRPFEANGTDKPLIRMLVKTPSFPSGHATLSFGIVFLIFWNHPFVLFWFVLFAIFVSLSRVAVRVHYFSDVIFGALIGLFVPFTLLSVMYYAMQHSFL